MALRLGLVLFGAVVLACSAPDASEPDSEGPVGPDDELIWSEGKADSTDSASLTKAFPEKEGVSCANAIGPLPPLGTGAESNWLELETPHFSILYRKTTEDRVVAAWLDIAPKDGHPDFVNEVAKGAEQGYSRFVGELDYPDPGKTTIYVKDAKGYFGYMSNGTVVVDNDSYAFRISRHFLRATVAHEYFHVLQAKLATSWTDQDRWLTESSAVWAEQEATDLWGGFVGGFVRDTVVASRLKKGVHESLLSNEPVFAANLGYATFLWEQFLVEKLGDPAAVKRMFELMGQGQSALGAASEMLEERGETLEETFREWTAWNYLVGSRDDGQHYSDGKSIFHGLSSSKVERTHQTPPSSWQSTMTPPALLAANYLEFDVQKGASSFSVEVAPAGDQWLGLTTLAKRRSDGKWVTTHHAPASGPSSVTLSAGEYSRVVLIVQHLLSDDVSVSQKPMAYQYRASAL